MPLIPPLGLLFTDGGSMVALDPVSGETDPAQFPVLASPAICSPCSGVGGVRAGGVLRLPGLAVLRERGVPRPFHSA